MASDEIYTNVYTNSTGPDGVGRITIYRQAGGSSQVGSGTSQVGSGHEKWTRGQLLSAGGAGGFTHSVTHTHQLHQQFATDSVVS